MELNKVFLVGNLTRDPESRFLQSGSQVVKMGLACNRRYSARDGDKREEVLFVDIEAWNKTAELCQQYLTKGSQILVEGRLKLDQYTTQNGEKRQRIFVVADRVQFGARAGEGGAGGGGGRSGGGSYGRGGGGGYDDAVDHDPGVAERDAPYSGDQTDDDLPF